MQLARHLHYGNFPQIEAAFYEYSRNGDSLWFYG